MRVSSLQILITGSQRGLGLTLAKQLHALGSDIILQGRNETLLKLLCEQMPGAQYIVADLSDPKDREELCYLVETKFPNLNGIILNAAVQLEWDILTTPDPWKKIEYESAVNFDAPAHILSRLLPFLSQNKQSFVLSISSVLAHAPKASTPSYCSSKAALHSLIQSLKFQMRNTSMQFYEATPPVMNTKLSNSKSNTTSVLKVADRIVNSLIHNKHEVYIGSTNVVKCLLRIAPQCIQKKILAQ